MPSSALAAMTQSQLGAQHDHERNRQAEQPAEHQHALAAPDVGKMSGDEIGERP